MSASVAFNRKNASNLAWLQSEVIREARRQKIDLSPKAMEAILWPITQHLPRPKPIQPSISRNRNAEDQIHQDLFARFMTAHLLPILKAGSAGNGPNGQLIPSYIPPLINAFRLVLGDNIISQSAGYLTQLEKRYSIEADSEIKKGFYQALAVDPHSKALFAEFTLRFLLSFERYSRRKNWLMKVVNSSLDKGYTIQEPKPMAPDFTMVHFTHFMTALALESNNSPQPNQLLRRILLRRFSSEHLPRFQAIFEAIQRDYAEVTLYSFQ